VRGKSVELRRPVGATLSTDQLEAVACARVAMQCIASSQDRSQDDAGWPFLCERRLRHGRRKKTERNRLTREPLDDPNWGDVPLLDGYFDAVAPHFYLIVRPPQDINLSIGAVAS
jgi:hypothetical protein